MTGVTFWPGRLLSLLATLGTALLIFAGVKQRAGAYSGFLAGTLFLMMPSSWTFGTLQRVDTLGAFFGCLSAYLLIVQNERRALSLFAGAAAILAFFTKTSIIASALAAVVYLFFTGRFKDCLFFAMGATGMFGIICGLLAFTGNESFWYNLSATADSPYSTQLAVHHVRSWFSTFPVLAAVAFAFFGLTLGVRRREGDVLFSFIYAGFSLTIAMATCFRVGSSLNYFHESAVPMCLLAGFALGRLVNEGTSSQRLAESILLVALMTDLVLQKSGFVRGRFLIPEAKRPIHVRLLRDIEDLVPEEWPIAGEYVDCAILSGRQFYFNDLGMYQLGPATMRSKLEHYISNKKLGAIVLSVYSNLPGYRLAPGYGNIDVPNVNTPGPLLYVREDLLEQRAKHTTEKK